MSQRPRSAGLSLLETVLGGFLLLTVMLGVLPLLPVMARQGNQSGDLGWAQSWASQALSEAQAAGPGALAASDPAPTPLAQAGITFTRQVAYTPVTGFDPAQLREVTVVVTWTATSISHRLCRKTRIVAP